MMMIAHNNCHPVQFIYPSIFFVLSCLVLWFQFHYGKKIGPSSKQERQSCSLFLHLALKMNSFPMYVHRVQRVSRNFTKHTHTHTSYQKRCNLWILICSFIHSLLAGWWDVMVTYILVCVCVCSVTGRHIIIINAGSTKMAVFSSIYCVCMCVFGLQLETLPPKEKRNPNEIAHTHLTSTIYCFTIQWNEMNEIEMLWIEFHIHIQFCYRHLVCVCVYVSNLFILFYTQNVRVILIGQWKKRKKKWKAVFSCVCVRTKWSSTVKQSQPAVVFLVYNGHCYFLHKMMNGTSNI